MRNTSYVRCRQQIALGASCIAPSTRSPNSLALVCMHLVRLVPSRICQSDSSQSHCIAEILGHQNSVASKGMDSTARTHRFGHLDMLRRSQASACGQKIQPMLASICRVQNGGRGLLLGFHFGGPHVIGSPYRRYISNLALPGCVHQMHPMRRLDLDYHHGPEYVVPTLGNAMSLLHRQTLVFYLAAVRLISKRLFFIGLSSSVTVVRQIRLWKTCCDTSTVFLLTGCTVY